MVVVFVVPWVPLKNIFKKLKIGKCRGLFVFTGSWFHGHGTVGVGCRFWRLPPRWFRNGWSEAAEVMALAGR